MKNLTIAAEHSARPETQKQLNIELQGGSPYFGYIWLNDAIYTIYEVTDENSDHVRFKIEPTR